MRSLILSVLLCLPAAAFAVGTGNDSPPKPTGTTIVCSNGMVWSQTLKKCVNPSHSGLGDDALYEAVRELAYADRLQEALVVLAAMSDPTDDRVLTYKGFVHRKLGHSDLAYGYYRQALDANPDNLLARSYMAQGFVADGRIEEARAELTEIRARGGRNTWAEAALRIAIDTGRLSSY